MKQLSEGGKVFPGRMLAVIEEFNGGEGTYCVNGDIKSEELGEVHYDIKNRKLEVKKITPILIIPKEGMRAIAEVGSVAKRDARVDIFMLDGHHIYPTYSGVVHISDISKDYLKNIDMAIRSGDIIKSKIINTKNNLNQLSIKGAEFGVIYAHCSHCGTIMEENQGKLKCPNCNRSERRKIAKTYGIGELA